MKTLLIGIKNVLLWSYGRGTWQYDILCLLIIATVFLLPGSFFGDRDRPMRAFHGQKDAVQANEALKVASHRAEKIQWDVGLEELKLFLQDRSQSEQLLDNPQEALVLYLRDHCQGDVALEGYQPQHDASGQMIGYRLWFR